MSADAIIDAIDAIDGSALEFRALTSGGRRRGVRLERVFWQALEAMARERGVRVGAVIEDIAGQAPDAANLTSALRVACAERLAGKSDELDRVLSPALVEAILTASPAPAFTLGLNRRIGSFNAAFSLLVRRHFAGAEDGEGKTDLRLSLDVGVEDIVARLDGNGNAPVATGYALVVGTRTHRGRVNVMRVPSREPALLLAFVAG